MIATFAAPAAMIVFAFTMVSAAISDVATMKIRNGLMLLFLLAYAVLAPLVGASAAEMGTSALLAAGVLVVGFAFFALGWMGGGDAKLAAVTALWLGADHTLNYLLYTALIGGALTLVILQFRMMSLPAILGNVPWIARLHSHTTGVPYGVAMALSALIVFPGTRWMTALF